MGDLVYFLWMSPTGKEETVKDDVGKGENKIG